MIITMMIWNWLWSYWEGKRNLNLNLHIRVRTRSMVYTMRLSLWFFLSFSFGKRKRAAEGKLYGGEESGKWGRENLMTDQLSFSPQRNELFSLSLSLSLSIAFTLSRSLLICLIRWIRWGRPFWPWPLFFKKDRCKKKRREDRGREKGGKT